VRTRVGVQRQQVSTAVRRGDDRADAG
jgi:hypothetical protein